MESATRVVPGDPGVGLGWTRLSVAIADQIPSDEIQRIWVFPALRREGREWGTAVVARPTEDRRLEISTAKYVMIVRGKDKGQDRIEVEEVGVSAEDVLGDVLRGVMERAGETEPPVEIPVSLWYPDGDDEITPEE